MKIMIFRKILIMGILIIVIGMSNASSINEEFEKNIDEFDFSLSPNNNNYYKRNALIDYRAFDNDPPQEEWNKTFGKPLYLDAGISVRQTLDRGYILLVLTYNYTNSESWLLKPDVDGNELWDYTFESGTFGSSVRQNEDGSYIVAGVKENNFYDQDLWLAKIDDSGNMIWDKILEPPYLYEGGLARSIELTNDGGYIIAGEAFNQYEDVNIWIIKIDTEGTVEWDRLFGSPEIDEYFDGADRVIQQTNDGGYIFVADKYPGFWLVKTDSKGEEKWNKTFNGGISSRGTAVGQTNDGGYFVAGGVTLNLTVESDVWLIKTDKYGNEEWNRRYGGDGGEVAYTGIHTIDGGYILTGSTDSFEDPYCDIWLIKIDADGDEEWNMTFGDLSRFDYAYSIQQTYDQGYIITGLKGVDSYWLEDAWLIKVAGKNKLKTTFLF
jgi:hypothetical protein